MKDEVLLRMKALLTKPTQLGNVIDPNRFHPDIHRIETAKALIDTWISSCDDIEKKHPKNTVTD